MAGLHQLQADPTALHHLPLTLEKDGWHGAFLITTETSCHLADNLGGGFWHGAHHFPLFYFFYERKVLITTRLYRF